MKVRLGEIATLINGDRGKNYPSQEDIVPNGEIPFVNAGHLDGQHISFDEMNYISRDKYERLNSGKFFAGDILYCLRGSLGKKAVVEGNIFGAIASSLVIIRPDNNLVDVNYLLSALDSPGIQEQLLKSNNGSSQPNLSAASVKKYEIELPTKEKQVDIVSRISKTKSIIEARIKELQKLDNLIKARFVEMFGDPEYNNKGWPVKKLDDLCNVGSSKRIYQEEQTMDGIPFWRISDLVAQMDMGNVESGIFIPESKYDELKVQGFVPEPGDILVTSRGTLGRCYIVSPDDRFYFQDGMISWLSRYVNEITPVYIKHLFDMTGFKKQIDNMQAGSTVPYLSIAMLKKLDVMLPSVETQNEFSTFVAQVNKSKSAIQKSLDETQLLFDSLMQQYFG